MIAKCQSGRKQKVQAEAVREEVGQKGKEGAGKLGH
jgi:hypothetical protein